MRRVRRKERKDRKNHEEGMIKGDWKRKIEGKDEEGRIWEGEIEEEDRRQG